jgi:hypothetical protein
MVMVSAFLTAPPPAALPPLATLVAILGVDLVFAVLIAAFAVGTAVLLQHAVSGAPRRRRAVQIAARRGTTLTRAA